MDRSDPLIVAASKAPTPCFVVSEALLKRNLEILDRVQKESGADIILALKGFAMHSVFPLIKKYLQGTTASSLHEARLGKEEFGGEVHVYAPAYRADEMDEILSYASHISFNSLSQWKAYKEICLKHPNKPACGLRLNPEFSEVKTPLYNPCYTKSRLGVTLKELNESELDGLTGLHFHTHCASNSDNLQRTLAVFEEKFGHLIPKMKWINFGGGHHISRPDYDVDLLIKLIKEFKSKYNVRVILEPGEAIALNTGFLVTSVLDILRNEVDIAMLDSSASAHCPDIIEMPFRPGIAGSGESGEFPHTYRLGGLTCLAGDVYGEYSFAEPLAIGDKLVILDMSHYSMVKTNTFNGVNLPSIAILKENSEIKIVKEFGYEDYRNRLS